MKLVHLDLDIDVTMTENYVNIIVIERPQVLRTVLEELVKQISGEEGDFILSSEGKIIPCSKHMYAILDPLSLDFNSSKIQTKLYQIIKAYVDETMIEKTGELNQQITTYLEKIVLSIPFSLTYDLDLEIQSLLKLYHVGIQTCEVGFVENIIEYMKVFSQLFSKNIVVFFNLKAWLSADELKYVYEYAFYSKINVLLIENHSRKDFEFEKMMIIDSDSCVIRY